MKAIMVMFDSLNLRMLPPYGCSWTHAPNFARLADRTAVFDNCYVGSMPCMPARRELHTGRYDFLHRQWGPLEPFDDCMPEMLKQNGIHSHLASDHYHYWEDGGANYHCRYSAWEFFRGQEGDPWKGDLRPIDIPETVGDRSGNWWRQDWVNRKYMPTPEDHCQTKTFDAGLEFMRANSGEDNWFLQIETFDPHEPFFSHPRYKELYDHEYDGPHYDWPDYGRVKESPDQIEHIRNEYGALLSMCDESLGRVLDLMDELELWDDTMLIVNTDHGFFLGEKGWLAKVVMPFYDEIAHIPLFIWDPRSKIKGERRSSLVQTIDLAPTILDYFMLEPGPSMQGSLLADTVANDKPVRDAGLFGIFGGHVNLVDDNYIYMRAPKNEENSPLHNQTLALGEMKDRQNIELVRDAEWAGPYSFTKGCRVMSYPGISRLNANEFGNLLFDRKNDPGQETPLRDDQVERKMIDKMVAMMRESEAPPEQYERLGLD